MPLKSRCTSRVRVFVLSARSVGLQAFEDLELEPTKMQEWLEGEVYDSRRVEAFL